MRSDVNAIEESMATLTRSIGLVKDSLRVSTLDRDRAWDVEYASHLIDARCALANLGKVLGKVPNARHSKETNRWGTPPEWVERACEAQGVSQVGLDPMSEETFQQVVRAKRFFTERDDCFKHPWECDSMLINPAGGFVKQAWRYLVEEWLTGRTKQAVWVGFSVEQLNLLADECLHPEDFCFLRVRKRIPFLLNDGTPSKRPSHANYIVGVGTDPGLFETAFEGLGKITFGHKVNQ